MSQTMNRTTIQTVIQTRATIVNLAPQSWTLYRSYGTFFIRGCADGEPYTLTHVHGRKALMDVGDKRTMDVDITANEVGEDLCGEINSDGGENSFFGAFVVAGEAPTEDELQQGRERLETFYRRLVAAADREWERSHSYLFINDVERRAAHYLGLEKEWFYQARETKECPACGERVKHGVAVCKTCRAILDPAKAALLGLTPPGHIASTAIANSASEVVTAPRD